MAPQRQAADLCPCCKLSKTTYETRPWDGPLDVLAAAGRSGCIRCSLLAKCIACLEPDAFKPENRMRAWGNFSCELTIYRGGVRDGYSLDIFSLPGQNSTEFPDLKVRSLLPGKTSSSGTISSLKHWMADCVREHDCSRSLSTNSVSFKRPRRLLELSAAGVKLQDAFSEEPIYACLSHCWGPPDGITKTTTCTLEAFKIDVPFDLLTQTFRDAVDICRRLEIRFLWIDALCIIQDSNADWVEESAKMADIYENAFLTIAATWSAESSTGCYSTTDDAFLARLVPGENIYVRRQPPLFPTHWSGRRSNLWPLLNRGWVYQEMRLSRRILHFCGQEVIWECRANRWSESGCSNEDIARDRRSLVSTMYEAVPYWKLVEDPRKMWYRTVQEYSGLQLTFGKDKMAALAALTQRMTGLRADSFIAGLWEKTLLLDLLWMVWPEPTSGRLEPWRAPSWSWACVQSQVMWESTEDAVAPTIQLKGVHYATSGPRHMGEFSEAVLTLQAYLVRATTIDLHGTPCIDPALPLAKYVLTKNYKNDYLFHLPGAHQIPLGTELFIMAIGISRKNHHHSALVLRRKSGDLTYERVGQVQLQHKNTDARIRNEDHERMRQLTYEDYVARGTLEDDEQDRLNSMLTALPRSNITLI